MFRWPTLLSTVIALSISAIAGTPAAQAATTRPTLGAVQYAEATWNWNWFDSSDHSTVAAGDYQEDFQCAEFVARALAFEGLIPNLSANAPQSAYGAYASGGKSYALWNVGTDTIAGLYDYLIQSGLGTDIGNNPAAASPGDVVFYYDGVRDAAHRYHTTLLTQTSPALYTGHNIAEKDQPYSTSAVSSIVHIKRPSSIRDLTAQTKTLASNTAACAGTVQYYTQNDYYGFPSAWTYANGSDACVQVSYTPATTTANCSFWFYVPAGDATSRVIFGYWDTGGTKHYAAIDENPVEGWNRVFTAANVTTINFQDNNGHAYPEQIGWGTGTGHGLQQRC